MGFQTNYVWNCCYLIALFEYGISWQLQISMNVVCMYVKNQNKVYVQNILWSVVEIIMIHFTFTVELIELCFNICVVSISVQ